MTVLHVWGAMQATLVSAATCRYQGRPLTNSVQMNRVGRIQLMSTYE